MGKTRMMFKEVGSQDETNSLLLDPFVLSRFDTFIAFCINVFLRHLEVCVGHPVVRMILKEFGSPDKTNSQWLCFSLMCLFIVCCFSLSNMHW